MKQEQARKIAIWVITANGVRLASKLNSAFPACTWFCIASQQVDQALAALTLPPVQPWAISRFDRLSDEVAGQFHRFNGHIFIMATGIVVRMLAPLILDKTRDPAVAVIDDRGKHCISLLSGHIGGANRMTLAAAQCIGANPVITTATDVNQVPAIDTLAEQAGLAIENPEAIKYVNMAFLNNTPIGFTDTENRLLPLVEERYVAPPQGNPQVRVLVDHRISSTGNTPRTLILRPQSLVAGMGCNRNTDMKEMKTLLVQTLKEHNLSLLSLSGLATVDIKNDEQGLLELARELSLPLQFFSREQLKGVDTIQTPSKMVEQHIGVPSVCEAAAILGARQGQLIVPKTNTKNVTVAIARQCST